MQINSPLSFLNKGIERSKNEQVEQAQSRPTRGSESKSANGINPDTVELYRKQGFSTSMVIETLTRSMSDKGFPAPIGNVNKQDAPILGEPIDPKSIFDYEKVAGEVLKFVGDAIYGAKSNGASDDELAEMLEQARAGVDLGFEQAREELSEADALNDDLAAGIDKSFELINKGIDNIEEDLFGRERELASRTSAYASSLDTSLEQSSEITITTKEGDKVTLQFSAGQQTSQQESYSRIDSGNQATEDYSMAYSQYSQFSFSYSVEGDLSEEEQAAISELVNDISDLQQDFFNGDLDLALEKATELGFDDELLQGYTLDLQQTETYQVAQAYAEVAQYKPLDESMAVLEKLTKPLFDYADRFNKLQEQAEQILADGKTQFTNLFDEILKAGFGNGEVDLQAMQDRVSQFNEKVQPKEQTE